MKDKIRKIIHEEVHAVIEIEEISKNLSKFFMNKIKTNIDEFVNDAQKVNWFCNAAYNFDLSNNILINELAVCVYNYKHNKEYKENYVSGAFTGKVFQKTVDNVIKYDSSIDIKIYNWDFKIEQIQDVFAHELHHVFDAAIRLNKKSKTKILNSVYRRLKLSYPGFINSNPLLKEFMDVFYLNLPEERNARIHMLHIESRKLKGLSKDEMIIKLGEMAPFKDFQRMYKFVLNDLSSISIDEKKQFVKYFNQLLTQEIIKKNLEEDNVHYSTNPEKFFQFWANQFRKNADELFKDAKGVVNHLTKNKLTENTDFHFLDGLSDDAIFALIGENFNEYD